eukprot:COSAG01_NODE_15_length_40797_cov_245.690550_15_plen_145_part_00
MALLSSTVQPSVRGGCDRTCYPCQDVLRGFSPAALRLQRRLPLERVYCSWVWGSPGDFHHGSRLDGSAAGADVGTAAAAATTATTGGGHAATATTAVSSRRPALWGGRRRAAIRHYSAGCRARPGPRALACSSGRAGCSSWCGG